MPVSEHTWKWFKKFPFTITCAIISAIFWIKPDLIPPELLLTHFFNNNFVIYFWLIVLAPFLYDYAKIIRLQYKFRNLRDSSGRHSAIVLKEEGHSPGFSAMDMVSFVIMIVGLLVINAPAAATPKFYES